MSESTQALLTHLFGHTTAVIDTCGYEDDPTKWEIFSGTLISIDGTLLMATASHCISKRNDLSRFWIQGDASSYKGDGCPDIIATHYKAKDDPDVGIIEIDEESLAKFSSKKGIALSRIQPVGIGRCDRLAILTGSPGERVKKEQDETSKGLCVRMDGYASRPWVASEWPSITLENPFDESKDIVMDYPDGTAHTRSLQTGKPTALPNPKGMSGGGLWDQGFNKGLWSPESAFMIGIQSSWLPKERYVRAVQVEHWLRLVHEKYERLRKTVEEEFPVLFMNDT